MRKNLRHIQLNSSISKVEGQKPLSESQHPAPNSFLTTEGIALDSNYSEKDIENLEHLDFGAGFAP